MIKKVEKYIEQYHMIEKGDRIVLGVSGGADSISLFFVMLELSKKYNIKIVVVHVNHGIRGEEARQDEEYVQKLCKERSIDFECVHAKVKELAKQQKLSEEEVGRKVRYEAFAQATKKYNCNKIAVAHNQNDVSETVLLNLFRGSGLKGLVGIEPIRGNIIRPLLCVERSEIEEYLLERNIEYHNDATNFETNYTRNKIRLKVLPYVEAEVNERASEHIAKSAGILSQASSFIDMEACKLYNQCVKDEDGVFEIELESFEKGHLILQKEVVRKVLFAIAKKQKDIEMSHVDSVLELIEKGAGKRVDLPYHMEAIHYYNKVVLRKKNLIKGEKMLEIEAVIPGSVRIPDTNMQLSFELITVSEDNRSELEKMYSVKKNDYTKWFDYDKIRNTVLARYRKTGDFFECNSSGNRKKLKDFFIDQKVPAEKRERILLLADGNHIIWVIGFRISEYYKVNSGTRRILKVKVDGGNEHDG